MWLAAIVAQVADLPEAGGGGWFYWLIGAGVILGLWFLIARTRRKSYRAYWERKRREEEMRANDPDMARPDESDAAE
jgi:hypothetical protein